MTTNLSQFLKGYVDYKNLDSFLEKEKGAGGLKESVFLVLIGQCISFLTISLAFAIGYTIIPGWAALRPDQAIISFFVMTVIVNAIIFYLTAALVFAGSKLLGGKGAFGTQAYLMGIVTFAAAVVSSPFIVLFVLLSQSALALLPQFAVLVLGVYQLYVFYKLVRATHGIPMLQALGVMLAALMALGLLFTFGFGQPPA